MIAVVLSAAFAALGLTIAGYHLIRSAQQRRRSPAPRNVLIVGAHQDDCTIVGSEYAQEALRANRIVSVAFLTAGAPGAEAPRARARRQEALSAWGHLGVPPERIAFLDLPQSEDGTSHITEDDALQAEGALLQRLDALPAPRALLAPDALEAHIDHQTLHAISRSIALARPDVEWLCVAEYNAVVSLRSDPRAALIHLLSRVPLLGRLAYRESQAAPVATALDPDTLSWPPSAPRLETKRRMLDYFTTENPDLLKQLFATPEHYRRAAPSTEPPPRGPPRFYALGAHHYDPPFAALAASMLGVLLSAPSALLSLLPTGAPTALLVLCAGLGTTLAFTAARGSARPPERRVILFSMGLGLVWAVAASVLG